MSSQELSFRQYVYTHALNGIYNSSKGWQEVGVSNKEFFKPYLLKLQSLSAIPDREKLQRDHSDFTFYGLTALDDKPLLVRIRDAGQTCDSRPGNILLWVLFLEDSAEFYKNDSLTAFHLFNDIQKKWEGEPKENLPPLSWPVESILDEETLNAAKKLLGGSENNDLINTVLLAAKKALDRTIPQKLVIQLQKENSKFKDALMVLRLLWADLDEDDRKKVSFWIGRYETDLKGVKWNILGESKSDVSPITTPMLGSVHFAFDFIKRKFTPKEVFDGASSDNRKDPITIAGIEKKVKMGGIIKEEVGYEDKVDETKEKLKQICGRYFNGQSGKVDYNINCRMEVVQALTREIPVDKEEFIARIRTLIRFNVTCRNASVLPEQDNYILSELGKFLGSGIIHGKNFDEVIYEEFIKGIRLSVHKSLDNLQCLLEQYNSFLKEYKKDQNYTSYYDKPTPYEAWKKIFEKTVISGIHDNAGFETIRIVILFLFTKLIEGKWLEKSWQYCIGDLIKGNGIGWIEELDQDTEDKASKYKWYSLFFDIVEAIFKDVIEKDNEALLLLCESTPSALENEMVARILDTIAVKIDKKEVVVSCWNMLYRALKDTEETVVELVLDGLFKSLRSNSLIFSQEKSVNVDELFTEKPSLAVRNCLKKKVPKYNPDDFYDNTDLFLHVWERLFTWEMENEEDASQVFSQLIVEYFAWSSSHKIDFMPGELFSYPLTEPVIRQILGNLHRMHTVPWAMKWWKVLFGNLSEEGKEMVVADNGLMDIYFSLFKGLEIFEKPVAEKSVTIIDYFIKNHNKSTDNIVNDIGAFVYTQCQKIHTKSGNGSTIFENLIDYIHSLLVPLPKETGMKILANVIKQVRKVKDKEYIIPVLDKIVDKFGWKPEEEQKEFSEAAIAYYEIRIQLVFPGGKEFNGMAKTINRWLIDEKIGMERYMDICESIGESKSKLVDELFRGMPELQTFELNNVLSLVEIYEWKRESLKNITLAAEIENARRMRNDSLNNMLNKLLVFFGTRKSKFNDNDRDYFLLELVVRSRREQKKEQLEILVSEITQVVRNKPLFVVGIAENMAQIHGNTKNENVKYTFEKVIEFAWEEYWQSPVISNPYAGIVKGWIIQIAPLPNKMNVQIANYISEQEPNDIYTALSPLCGSFSKFVEQLKFPGADRAVTNIIKKIIAFCRKDSLTAEIRREVIEYFNVREYIENSKNSSVFELNAEYRSERILKLFDLNERDFETVLKDTLDGNESGDQISIKYFALFGTLKKLFSMMGVRRWLGPYLLLRPLVDTYFYNSLDSIIDYLECNTLENKDREFKYKKRIIIKGVLGLNLLNMHYNGECFIKLIRKMYDERKITQSAALELLQEFIDRCDEKSKNNENVFNLIFIANRLTEDIKSGKKSKQKSQTETNEQYFVDKEIRKKSGRKGFLGFGKKK